MAELGRIKEVTVTDEKVVCIVSLAGGPTKTCNVYGLAGVDTYPMPGDQVKIDYCDGEWVLDAVFRAVQAGIGETILYSRDSNGDTSATVKVDSSGNVILNSGTKSAVNFADLKTAFNQLKSDFDNFVSSTYGPHIHVTTATIGATPTPGVISPTTSTGSPSTADIDPAESNTVKVP